MRLKASSKVLPTCSAGSKTEALICALFGLEFLMKIIFRNAGRLGETMVREKPPEEQNLSMTQRLSGKLKVLGMEK